MANVSLTRHLYQFFPDLEGRDLQVDATNVAEVVQGLDRLAPGLASYLCDERGRLRTHVNVFVGQERLADRISLSDPVPGDATVHIIQALSGG